MNEFKLIENFQEILYEKSPKNNEKKVVGIGDDCALVDLSKKTVVTVDSMVEDVHFKRWYDPKDIGFKLTSMNASDIASCGGVPKYGVLSIEFPKDLDKDWMLRCYKGIKKGCKKYGFSIVGGNTSSSNKISLNLTLFGETKKFLSRSGAKKGDLLFLSGETGLSKRGLEILLEDLPMNKKLVKTHLNPIARTDLGKFLAKYGTSGIDISDGLLQDLGHICEKSKKSFQIFSNKIPINRQLKKSLGCKKKALDYTLNGGEDYQILCTIPPKHKVKAKKLGLIEIGYTQIGSGIFLDENKVNDSGFKHF
ncbi:MAG: thiamine-phosphate kinase [Campylobacterales bacterium]|nr:thiamine-phosphate kinase [Campylobacterales bacterium]